MDSPDQNLHTGSRAQSEGNDPTSLLTEGGEVKCKVFRSLKIFGNRCLYQLLYLLPLPQVSFQIVHRLFLQESERRRRSGRKIQLSRHRGV